MDGELELMMRLKKGDESALTRLYERLGRNVYALAFEMLRNHEDAEEVRQDTFVYLFRRADRFDPERGSVRAYIYTIARTESLMRLRAKRSRPLKAADIDLHDAASPFATAGDADHETRIVVRHALSQLQMEDARLLEASFLQGYTHAELAERTGLQLGTLKSRIRRALLKLRDLLEDA